MASATPNASISYKSYLMKKGSGTTYETLVPIVSYPDLGGEPEKIDITTLSDSAYCYTDGLETNENKTFDCNYELDKYTSLKALEGTEHDYAVFFGDDGDKGKFGFSGKLRVFVNGAGVNEARKMTVTIVPSTPVTLLT